MRAANQRALDERRHQAATLLASRARGSSARLFVKDLRREVHRLRALAAEYEALRLAVKAEVECKAAERRGRAATRIQAAQRGVQGRWQYVRRREASEEQLALARDFEGLRAAVKAEVGRTLTLTLKS